jgi:hypothetical protein
MATVTKGRTFVSGEIITPAKLNNVVDLATVTNIQTADIADGQITTAKILDANVTDAKLATGIDASKLTTGTLPIARIADGVVTPAKLFQPLTLAAAQATTSGTSIDFTGIPSWVKRITVMLNEVSTNGTSRPLLQIGDGSIVSSGYSSGARDTTINTAGGGPGASAGFIIAASSAANVLTGHIILTLVSSNTWCCSHTVCFVDGVPNIYVTVGAGRSPALSGTLDRIRLTTVNGTDTFDAGSVNIMYEG